MVEGNTLQFIGQLRIGIGESRDREDSDATVAHKVARVVVRSRIAAVLGLIVSELMFVRRDLTTTTVVCARGVCCRVIVSGVGVSADQLGQDERKRGHG